MTRVFIAYAESDGEAALYLATQLRGRGVDLYVDYDHMMNGENFTRHLMNEIRGANYVVFIQSKAALNSGLVQAELSYAVENNVTIVPLVLEKFNLRESGEFAAVLNNNPIDFSEWMRTKQARTALNELETRLRKRIDDDGISVDTVGSLTELVRLEGHSSWVRTARFSPDGNTLASCANDHTIKLWDTRNRDIANRYPPLMTTLTAHQSSVWDVAFSPTENILASCGNDNTVRMWDLDEYPEPLEFTRFVDHHDPVFALAFSPDGDLLASASKDNSVHLRDIRRIKVNGIAEAIVPLLHSSFVYSVSFSHDSQLIASGGMDSTVRVWKIDRNNLRSLARAKPDFLIGHMSWVNTVAFSPTQPLLVSCSHDKTIRFWDVENKRDIGVLTGHRDSVNTVAFSPDGRLLASTSKDDTLRVWDVSNGQELLCIQAHEKWANGVVFSPNGKLIVTTGGDNSIKFWGVSKSAQR
ncbi:MAG: TIR domain-containing protein [bacterium]|nr:TIR domain-containing protein [bacterium]